MAHEIFISYKRGADSSDASLLYNALAEEFGSDSVFMDIDNVPLGIDFVAHIREQVSRCKVVIMVVGNGFHQRIGELSDPQDFMRLELEEALREPDTSIIPIMFDNATMPAETDWPEPLRPLSVRGGLSVPNDHSSLVIRGGLIPQLRMILQVPELEPAIDDRAEDTGFAQAPMGFVGTAEESRSALARLLSSLQSGVARLIARGAGAFLLLCLGLVALYSYFPPFEGFVNRTVTAFVVSTKDPETPFIPNAFGRLLATLSGYEAKVVSAAYAPDGTQIAGGAVDGTLRILDAATGDRLHELVGHDDTVTNVAFSPDGSTLASGSVDGTLRLWDTDRGALMWKAAPEDGWIYGLAFSPDGTRIVSGSGEGSLQIWDTQSGDLIGSQMLGHSDLVRSVAFSPDGTMIASGSNDKTLRLWNAETAEAIGSPMEGHEHWVLTLAFSPDGRRIVSGSSDNTLRIWSVAETRQLGPALTGHTDWVRSVAFSPDGSRIVSSSEDGTSRLWNANNARELEILISDARQSSLARGGDAIALFGRTPFIDVHALRR